MAVRPRSVTLRPSTRAAKKLMATFEMSDGTQRRVHFGARGMSDYTKHRDPARKKRYIARHRVNENWRDPLTAGALSRYVLWNKPTVEASMADFRRRFGLM